MLAMIVVLGSFLLFRRRPAVAATLAVTFGVASYLGQTFNRYLNNAVWDGRGGIDAGGKVSRLFHADGLGDALLTGAGQIWYQVVASGGLAVIAVVGLLLLTGNRRDMSADRRVTAAIIVIVTGALVGVSVVFLANGRRADHLVYGRYIDIVAPLLIALAISWLATRPATRGLLVAALSLVTVLFGTWAILEVWATQRFEQPFNRVTAISILGWIDHKRGSPALVRATFWTAAIGLTALAIAYVAGRVARRGEVGDPAVPHRRAALLSSLIAVLVICLFAWQLGDVRRLLLRGLARDAANTAVVVDAVRAAGVSDVTLEPSVTKVDELALEYWLPTVTFHAATPETTRCSTVVSLSREPDLTPQQVSIGTASGIYLSRGTQRC
jgi:hypothetical protein